MEQARGTKMFLLTILGTLATGVFLDYGQFVVEGSQFILQADAMVDCLGMEQDFVSTIAKAGKEEPYLDLIGSLRSVILFLIFWSWIYVTIL